MRLIVCFSVKIDISTSYIQYTRNYYTIWSRPKAKPKESRCTSAMVPHHSHVFEHGESNDNLMLTTENIADSF
jgi:hypothetical protein